ncbi:MAG: VOC family protein [Burkholderiaceae bacterium]|jgi:2,3-dihydroxybiphenyl 1,2-dioxygenase|nr:VOC family protein [Burkholderiaceae bacterium]
MSGIKELAYVGYEVSDLAAWEHFAVNLLGMQITPRGADGFSLRMDQKAQRWLITQGAADDLVVSGYAVDSDTALDQLIAELQAAGFKTTEGDARLAAARQVDRIVVTADPMGNRIELVTHPHDAPAPFHSDVLTGPFLTGACGLGHQFIVTQNEASQAQALNFYHTLLGFHISDRIIAPLAPGLIADAMFLHCNPRHHTVALGAIPIPKKIHHVMIQVAQRQDVGYAWDRCLKAGQPLEMTLGSHPNDHMLSFYVKTPSGFAVEYGWGGLTIDDESAWQVRTYDTLDDWGHHPPAQELTLLQQGLPKPPSA